MEFSNENQVIMKGKNPTFPWVKAAKRSFLKSFSKVYNNEDLLLLHKNIYSEFQLVSKEKDLVRTEAFYSALIDLYLHFCWKINWHEESFLQLFCVQIMYFLVNTALILGNGDETSTWNDHILTLLLSFPGDTYLMLDVFLLIKKIRKKYHSPFILILKHILFKEYIKKPADAESFIKLMMLYRRLIFASNKSMRKEIFITASEVECPSDVMNWISLNVNNVQNFKPKNAFKKFLSKKLEDNTFEQIYKVLLQKKYGVEFSNIIECKVLESTSKAKDTDKISENKLKKENKSSQFFNKTLKNMDEKSIDCNSSNKNDKCIKKKLKRTNKEKVKTKLKNKKSITGELDKIVQEIKQNIKNCDEFTSKDIGNDISINYKLHDEFSSVKENNISKKCSQSSTKFIKSKIHNGVNSENNKSFITSPSLVPVTNMCNKINDETMQLSPKIHATPRKCQNKKLSPEVDANNVDIQKKQKLPNVFSGFLEKEKTESFANKETTQNLYVESVSVDESLIVHQTHTSVSANCLPTSNPVNGNQQNSENLGNPFFFNPLLQNSVKNNACNFNCLCNLKKDLILLLSTACCKHSVFNCQDHIKTQRIENTFNHSACCSSYNENILTPCMLNYAKELILTDPKLNPNNSFNKNITCETNMSNNKNIFNIPDFLTVQGIQGETSQIYNCSTPFTSNDLYARRTNNNCTEKSQTSHFTESLKNIENLAQHVYTQACAETMNGENTNNGTDIQVNPNSVEINRFLHQNKANPDYQIEDSRTETGLHPSEMHNTENCGNLDKSSAEIINQNNEETCINLSDFKNSDTVERNCFSYQNENDKEYYANKNDDYRTETELNNLRTHNTKNCGNPDRSSTEIINQNNTETCINLSDFKNSDTLERNFFSHLNENNDEEYHANQNDYRTETELNNFKTHNTDNNDNQTSSSFHQYDDVEEFPYLNSSDCKLLNCFSPESLDLNEDSSASIACIFASLKENSECIYTSTDSCKSPSFDESVGKKSLSPDCSKISAEESPLKENSPESVTDLRQNKCLSKTRNGKDVENETNVKNDHTKNVKLSEESDSLHTDNESPTSTKIGKKGKSRLNSNTQRTFVKKSHRYVKNSNKKSKEFISDNDSSEDESIPETQNDRILKNKNIENEVKNKNSDIIKYYELLQQKSLYAGTESQSAGISTTSQKSVKNCDRRRPSKKQTCINIQNSKVNSKKTVSSSMILGRNLSKNERIEKSDSSYSSIENMPPGEVTKNSEISALDSSIQYSILTHQNKKLKTINSSTPKNYVNARLSGSKNTVEEKEQNWHENESFKMKNILETSDKSSDVTNKNCSNSKTNSCSEAQTSHTCLNCNIQHICLDCGIEHPTANRVFQTCVLKKSNISPAISRNKCKQTKKGKSNIMANTKIKQQVAKKCSYKRKVCGLSSVNRPFEKLNDSSSSTKSTNNISSKDTPQNVKGEKEKEMIDNCGSDLINSYSTRSYMNATDIQKKLLNSLNHSNSEIFVDHKDHDETNFDERIMPINKKCSKFKKDSSDNHKRNKIPKESNSSHMKIYDEAINVTSSDCLSLAVASDNNSCCRNVTLETGSTLSLKESNVSTEILSPCKLKKKKSVVCKVTVRPKISNRKRIVRKNIPPSICQNKNIPKTLSDVNYSEFDSEFHSPHTSDCEIIGIFTNSDLKSSVNEHIVENENSIPTLTRINQDILETDSIISAKESNISAENLSPPKLRKLTNSNLKSSVNEHIVENENSIPTLTCINQDTLETNSIISAKESNISAENLSPPKLRKMSLGYKNTRTHEMTNKGSRIKVPAILSDIHNSELDSEFYSPHTSDCENSDDCLNSDLKSLINEHIVNETSVLTETSISKKLFKNAAVQAEFENDTLFNNQYLTEYAQNSKEMNCPEVILNWEPEENERQNQIIKENSNNKQKDITYIHSLKTAFEQTTPCYVNLCKCKDFLCKNTNKHQIYPSKCSRRQQFTKDCSFCDHSLSKNNSDGDDSSPSNKKGYYLRSRKRRTFS